MVTAILQVSRMPGILAPGLNVPLPWRGGRAYGEYHVEGDPDSNKMILLGNSKDVSRLVFNISWLETLMSWFVTAKS